MVRRWLEGAFPSVPCPISVLLTFKSLPPTKWGVIRSDTARAFFGDLAPATYPIWRSPKSLLSLRLCIYWEAKNGLTEVPTKSIPVLCLTEAQLGRKPHSPSHADKCGLVIATTFSFLTLTNSHIYYVGPLPRLPYGKIWSLQLPEIE